MASAFVRWLDRHYDSAGTIRNYVARVEVAERWLRGAGLPPLREASWENIRAWGETLPYTNASRQLARSALKAYWSYLGRKASPLKAIRCPRKPKASCRALPPGAVEKVLAAAGEMGPRPYAVCCFLYYAALRRFEAATLRWPWIASEEFRFVGKGQKEAMLPLHPKLRGALEGVHGGSEWVFPGRYPGTHIALNTVNVWVKLAGAAAGLNGSLSPHILRHTALAEMNDGSGDLRAVSEFARHEDVRTTQIYTRTTPAKLRSLLAYLR